MKTRPVNPNNQRRKELAAMRTTIFHVGGVLVLAVFGRLNASSANRLVRTVQDTLSTRVGCFVIDLAGVTQIDVAGLGALFESVLAARHSNARIALVGSGRADTLMATRVLTIDDVFASASDAIERLTRRTGVRGAETAFLEAA